MQKFIYFYQMNLNDRDMWSILCIQNHNILIEYSLKCIWILETCIAFGSMAICIYQNEFFFEEKRLKSKRKMKILILTKKWFPFEMVNKHFEINEHEVDLK